MLFRKYFASLKNIANREWYTIFKLLSALIAAIFLIEFVIMRVLLRSPLGLVYDLIDSTLLVAILFPLLYFILFRPMLLEINRRVRTENDLREANSFNESLLRNSPFDMGIIDEAGNILFLDARLESRFGKEGVGKKCWQLFKDDKKQCSGCPLKTGVPVGQTVTTEMVGAMGGRTLRITHTGILYQGKKAILEFYQDITEYKKMEEDLVKVRIEEEQLKMLRVLTATYTHNIFNALAPIKGFAELILKKTEPAEKLHDYARKIIECSTDAVEIVNRLKEIESAEKKTIAGIEILDIESHRKE